MEQVAHQSQHPVAALREGVDFLLCLYDGKFCRAQNTTRDILQSVLAILLLHRQHLAHEGLYLVHEAYQHQCVKHIERRVEGRKLVEVVVLYPHHIGYKPAHRVACRVEHEQYQQHTEYVEEHVSQCRPSCLCIRRERSHERRDGGTDVLTHRQCRSLLESETLYVHVEQHQGDGHSSSRSLHNHGHYGTHDDKDDDGEDIIVRNMRQHASHQIPNVQVGSSCLQEAQTHEQERETEDELTQGLPTRLIVEDERQTEGQQRNGESRDVYLESHSRDNPCGDRSTHVGTHNHSDGLFQRHQSRIHERNHHDRGGAGRLDKGCNQNTGENSHDPVLGHRCQDRTEPISRKLFQTLTHDLHSVEEETQRTQKR